MGGYRRDRRSSLPPQQGQPAVRSDSLFQHYNGLHGQSRGISGPISPPSIRRDQLCYSPRTFCRTDGHVGLARRRLDVTGPGNPSLPRSPRGSFGCVVFPPSWPDFLQCAAGTSATTCDMTPDAPIAPSRFYSCRTSEHLSVSHHRGFIHISEAEISSLNTPKSSEIRNRLRRAMNHPSKNRKCSDMNLLDQSVWA